MPKFISDSDMAALEGKTQKRFISDEEMNALDSSGVTTPERSLGEQAKAGLETYVIDQLPALGAAAGGTIGGVLGLPAGGVGAVPGALGGAGVGGYLGKATQNLYNEYVRPEKGPKSNYEVLASPIEAAAEGIAGEGVGMGAGKALGAAVSAGAKGAKFAGKKAFTSVFGVSEDNASKYLANSERINAAPEVQAIKARVDETMAKLKGSYDSAKISKQEAAETLRDMQRQITNELGDQKLDKREAARRAEEMLKEAWEKTLQPLKSTRAPTDRAVDASEMVQTLKGQVTKGSSDAYNVLDQAKERVDLNPVYKQIDDTIDGLSGYGTDESAAIISKLQKYKARLMGQNWANIDAPEAKRLIQGLDQVTDYNPNATAFDQASNKAFKGVRSSLDDALKTQVPEYRAAMVPVAEKASLLSSASEAFGRPEIGAGKLGRLDTPRGKFDRAILENLEKAAGKPGDITRSADEYARIQALLKNPQKLGAMKASLPESQAVKRAEMELARRNPKWTREQVKERVAKSMEARRLSEAETQLGKARGDFEPFQGITEGTSESQIRSVMRGEDKNFRNRDRLVELGKKAGEDFVQAADDRSVLDSFSKSNTNGSRNTLIGALVGGALGGVPGMVAGGTTGRVVLDQYGPKVGKKILDGMIKLKASPNVQTLRSLDLPEPIKQELEKSFRLYQVRSRVTLSNQAKIAEQEKKQPNRSPSKSVGNSR